MPFSTISLDDNPLSLASTRYDEILAVGSFCGVCTDSPAADSLTEATSASAASTLPDCPICLEKVHEENVTLACGHQYCTTCIARYVRTRLS